MTSEDFSGFGERRVSDLQRPGYRGFERGKANGNHRDVNEMSTQSGDFELYWAERQAFKAGKRNAKVERDLRLKQAKKEYADKVAEAEERYRWAKKTAKKTFEHRCLAPVPVEPRCA
jgi:hypothetical protein